MKPRLGNLLRAPAAYRHTRTLARQLVSRARIERHQARASARLVDEACATIPFYRRHESQLGAMPVASAAIMMLVSSGAAERPGGRPFRASSTSDVTTCRARTPPRRRA